MILMQICPAWQGNTTGSVGETSELAAFQERYRPDLEHTISAALSRHRKRPIPCRAQNST